MVFTIQKEGIPVQKIQLSLRGEPKNQAPLEESHSIRLTTKLVCLLGLLERGLLIEGHEEVVAVFTYNSESAVMEGTVTVLSEREKYRATERIRIGLGPAVAYGDKQYLESQVLIGALYDALRPTPLPA